MYEVFDSFLNKDTWHTSNATDGERFYKALDQVVWSDAFSPDKMADYMRSKKNLAPDDLDSQFAKSIENCFHNAWAVKEFVKYSNVSKKQ